MKRLYELYIHKVLFVSKLGLAIVLGYALVTTVIGGRGTTEVFAPKSVSGGISATEPTTPLQMSPDDYSEIAARNVFSGAAGSENSLPDVQGSDVMQSANRELGLALVGTAVVSDATLSRALIRDLQSNSENMYRQGDLVAGAYIKSIKDDRVILIHRGRQKVLTIAVQSGGRGQSSAATGPTSKQAVEPAKASLQTATQTSVQADFGSVDALLKEAVIEPHMVNGTMEGLEITGLEKIPGAALLGLQNGDVIRTVNGHTLTSRQKAFQVFKKSRSQPSIDLELMRNDEIKTLSFDLK